MFQTCRLSKQLEIHHDPSIGQYRVTVLVSLGSSYRCEETDTLWYFVAQLRR